MDGIQLLRPGRSGVMVSTSLKALQKGTAVGAVVMDFIGAIKKHYPDGQDNAFAGAVAISQPITSLVTVVSLATLSKIGQRSSMRRSRSCLAAISRSASISTFMRIS